MNDMFIVAGIAIGSLTAIACMALYKGVNGKLLTTVVGAVCTIAGFAFGSAV